MMSSTRRSLSLAAMLGLIAGTPALAGDLFGEGPLDLQAGGLVFVMPKYEGSKDYDVYGIPLVMPAGPTGFGRLQFRGTEDIRFRLLDFNGLEFGPVTGWRFDRDESDSSHLRGLGDVDGGLVVGGYAAYRTDFLTPYLSYATQVTGDDTGGLLRFGVEGPLAIWSGVSIIGRVGATWADDDYMDAFFSVTPAQSLASLHAPYDASAGIKDVNVGFAADVPLDANWSLKLLGQYSRLIGDAADSPVIETEDQFYGGVGLTYRFTLDR